MPFTPGERAGAATYARIQREALELFAAQGVAATSTRQISARMGTTVAALYYYFRSKDELVRVLVEPFFTRRDDLLASFDGKGPLSAEEKCSLLEGYLASLLGDVRLTRLVSLDLTVRNHPEFGPRLDAQLRRLEELLAGPKASQADVVLASAALGTIRRTVLELEGVDFDEVRDLLVDAAMAVLESKRPTRHGTKRTSRASKRK